MEKNWDEYVSEVTTNFKRGTAEMLLLALLTQSDHYAYELSKMLRESSRGLFDLQGPSFYTVLYRMQERGIVESRAEPNGGRTRIYYSITPKGREYLDRIVASYLKIDDGIKQVMLQTGLLGKENS